MLILSRKRDEQIAIVTPAGLVTIIVIDIQGDKVRLGVDAPREIPVHRLKVHEAIKRKSKRRKDGAA